MTDYCCEFMRQQLEYDCPMHGRNCPDVVIAPASSQGHDGQLLLIGRNAEYECRFCPYCGTRWSGASPDEEASPNQVWGRPA